MASPIKSYNLTELANLYEETPRTIKNWLKPHKEIIGEKQGQKYSPKQVEKIFQILGLPKKDTE